VRRPIPLVFNASFELSRDPELTHFDLGPRRCGSIHPCVMDTLPPSNLRYERKKRTAKRRVDPPSGTLRRVRLSCYFIFQEPSAAFSRCAMWQPAQLA
jgi:hypothetical protein